MGRVLWGLALLAWLLPFARIPAWLDRNGGVNDLEDAGALYGLVVGAFGALAGLALCTAITVSWWSRRASAGAGPVVGAVLGAPALLVALVAAFVAPYFWGWGFAPFLGLLVAFVVGAYALNVRLLAVAPRTPPRNPA